jgi:hypothetical protein
MLTIASIIKDLLGTKASHGTSAMVRRKYGMFCNKATISIVTLM